MVLTRMLLRRRFLSTNRSLPQGFYEEIMGIHKTDLEPMNKRLLGPVSRFTNETTKLPFVFLLGNHSSGKSTFVNHVLGRNVQHTGVAPTDDSFTVIAGGNSDMDQDGTSLVGDPDMGFAGLRRFGSTFLTHLRYKVRSDLDVNDVMLIDSPGMIDSPSQNSSGEDRGYDFGGVAQWLAQRADVILLFFDPANPGTTGETLATLTHSLRGSEHKLHLVLNKADSFTRMNDFARAYGALCWNLSKVIERKDLPRIYTMCVPVQEVNGDVVDSTENALQQGIANDLQTARNEVIEQVLRAPERRIDNMVTQLHNSALMLSVHARVGSAVRRAYSMIGIKQWASTFSIFALSQAIAAGGLYAFEIWEFGVAMSSIGFAVAGTHHYFSHKQVRDDRSHLKSDEGLSEIFRETFHKELSSGDFFVKSIWEQRVRPQIQTAMNTSTGVPRIEQATSAELSRLNEIMNVDVPRLRSAVAPLLKVDKRR